MKTAVKMFCLLAAMIFIVPAFAGQEPYKALVDEDTDVPGFYISPKLYQFTHPHTSYLNERFVSQTFPTRPELCCTPDTRAAGECPDQHPVLDALTSLTSKGNSGWYEWWIQVPKKPEGEMNLEIECGVLKPNETDILECAAETGEIVDPGCTRRAGSYLNPNALPTIEAIAYAGCQNNFDPFHLTAYKNPGPYTLARPILNSIQTLDGGPNARIALKGCMDKTVLVKWPKEGQVNLLGETETALRAGDIIKVRMNIPTANTVDVYCNKYSVKIGGIGEPLTILPDGVCPVVCFDHNGDGFCDTCPDVVVPYGVCD